MGLLEQHPHCMGSPSSLFIKELRITQGRSWRDFRNAVVGIAAQLSWDRRRNVLWDRVAILSSTTTGAAGASSPPGACYGTALHEAKSPVISWVQVLGRCEWHGDGFG